MIAEKQVILTSEGLSQLEEELELLKTVRRKDISEKIKQALSFGDLSENSEYDEAKNEQAQVEYRIMQLENMLKNAKIIDESEIDISSVNIGSKVRVLDVAMNDEMEYLIVGSTEADPMKFKISDESPIGRALLGAKVGETVDAAVPSGDVLQFKILGISK